MNVKMIKYFGKNAALPSRPQKYVRFAEIKSETTREKLIMLGIGIAAALLAFAVGCIIVPVSELFAVSGMFMLILRLVVIVALAYGYLFLYELLHAKLLQLLCGKEPQKDSIGFGLAACTSDFCFNPKAFFTVKLAPTLAVFVLLLIISLILPSSLFWVVYIIQIINLACAAPYYCLAAVLLKAKKKDILIDESANSISAWFTE